MRASERERENHMLFRLSTSLTHSLSLFPLTTPLSFHSQFLLNFVHWSFLLVEINSNQIRPRVPDPTNRPSNGPTRIPTNNPTERPTPVPTNRPTNFPTRILNQQTTGQPNDSTSRRPSSRPTRRPSRRPSRSPTRR